MTGALELGSALITNKEPGVAGRVLGVSRILSFGAETRILQTEIVDCPLKSMLLYWKTFQYIGVMVSGVKLEITPTYHHSIGTPLSG